MSLFSISWCHWGRVFHGRALASRACLCKAQAAAGRDPLLLEDVPPACQAGAARTGSAQERTKSGSHTLRLLNFDTTYREGQRLRVCQGKVGVPTLVLVFSFLTSAVVLLHNLAGLTSALHTPCPTQELYKVSAGTWETNIALDTDHF